MAHPEQLKAEMVEAVRFLHARGWAPATSSNYSFQMPGQTGFFVSASGIDKGSFGHHHFLDVTADGAPAVPGTRPSAETLLHAAVYEVLRPAAVLHTHSVPGTVLSIRHRSSGGLMLEGFEILKGLEGIRTHESRIFLPIFANSQDMRPLADQIRDHAKGHSDFYGFLLEGHGLYTWGPSIAAAKRHVEVFEFLFECLLRLPSYSGHGNSSNP